MLYKKVHRQHVKEWRIGRKFKFFGVQEITREPYIDGSYIKVRYVMYNEELKDVDDTIISMTGEESGRMWFDKNIITWLN